MSGFTLTHGVGVYIALSNQGCKRRRNLNQKILHDERIFFYKDDLVLAHMGANSRRALILSNWFLDGR